MKSNARVGLWCAACGAPAGRAKGRRTRAHREAAARALVRAAEAASIPGGAAVRMDASCWTCGAPWHRGKCPAAVTPDEKRAYFRMKSMEATIRRTGRATLRCRICDIEFPRRHGGKGAGRLCGKPECAAQSKRRARMARNASKRRRDARVRQRRPGRAPNCQRDRDAWGSYHPLAIFDRDGWRCRYCACEVSRDVPPQAPNRASIDHVVPLNGETVSGLDVIFNVVTACRACNSAKSNRLDFKKEAS